MLMLATAATVEKARLLLKFVKNDFRLTMREDRLNGLMLLYIHKDIVLEYETLINHFANKYQREILLVNPLE